MEHRKETDSCNSNKTPSVLLMKTNPVKVVQGHNRYSEDQMKRTNHTLCGKHADFLGARLGGTHSNH